MNRALRLLAVVSLIAAVVFAVVVKATPGPADPASITYYQITLPLFAQTSLLLAIAVGVATVTIAAWRGQRAWVIGVLVALLVVVYGFTVLFYYLPVSAQFNFINSLFAALPFLSSIYVLELAIVPALLPILALVYTSLPRGASTSTVVQTPAATAPSATANRALLLLAALALLVALSVIPLAAYATSNPNGAASHLLIGLGAQLLRKTSFLLAFGVGIAALTEAVWRRQRAGAWSLLLALLVGAYGLILFTYIFWFHNVAAVLNRLPGWLLQQYVSANVLGNPPIPYSANLLGDSFIPALLALMVLAYSLRRPQAGANTVPESERAPSQPQIDGLVEPIS